MKDVYLHCGISKQAHAQALLRQKLLETKEQVYIGFIDMVRQFHPGMGLRKMYQQFNPEGIGRDAFIALGLLNGFRLRVMRSPLKTTRSFKGKGYPNLLAHKIVTDVNQVWVSDIFYFSINGQHYYVVLIMDVYSRRIIGYHGGDHLRATANIKALQRALTLRGIQDYNERLIHHSDRGSQYISEDYTALLDSYGIQISMCKNVLENAHAERVNGTIKNDYLAKWNIKKGKYFDRWVNKAVEAYNNRAHDNIGKKTPINYEIYIKELPNRKRNRMKIFTIQKQDRNPYQLSLFDEL